MTSFRTEIIGLNDRDQVMLRALLANLQTRSDLQWVPDDNSAGTVHFVDVESPVGHRYWRGLSESEQRGRAIALAYRTPTHIDAQARWLGKPIRSGALQATLMELFGSDRHSTPHPELMVSAPITHRRVALLQRLEAFRETMR